MKSDPTHTGIFMDKGYLYQGEIVGDSERLITYKNIDQIKECVKNKNHVSN